MLGMMLYSENFPQELTKANEQLRCYLLSSKWLHTPIVTSIFIPPLSEMLTILCACTWDPGRHGLWDNGSFFVEQNIKTSFKQEEITERTFLPPHLFPPPAECLHTLHIHLPQSFPSDKASVFFWSHTRFVSQNSKEICFWIPFVQLFSQTKCLISLVYCAPIHILQIRSFYVLGVIF